MIRSLFFIIILAIVTSCSSQFNKGVIEKRELRKKKPPSVRIAEDYDRKASQGTKTYSNPKRAARAADKQSAKQKKAGDKYLRKKKRKKN